MPPERRAGPPPSAVLVAVVLVVAAWVGACSGQPEEGRGKLAFSEVAAMTRGPAEAPVTIVEFSDYQ